MIDHFSYDAAGTAILLPTGDMLLTSGAQVAELGILELAELELKLQATALASQQSPS